MTARDEDFRTPYLMAMILGGITAREADELLDAHDTLLRSQVIQEVAARLGDGMFWFDARDRTSAMATVLSMAPPVAPQSMCRCGHPEYRHAPFAVVDSPTVQCVICAAGDRDNYQHPYTPTQEPQ